MFLIIPSKENLNLLNIITKLHFIYLLNRRFVKNILYFRLVTIY
jgi:hypothetical protein